MSPAPQAATMPPSVTKPATDVASTAEAKIEWQNMTLMPEDPIFKLLGECMADNSPDRINLSVGAYRCEDGKPWVLPVVQKAKHVLLTDESANHEYFGLDGNPSFNEASARLILGADSPALKAKRYTAIQAVSGTGANRLAADFLAKFRPATYWNPKTRSLNYDILLENLRNAERGSIFVLHACAHNPTGLDPTQEQWKEIASIMKEKDHSHSLTVHTKDSLQETSTKMPGLCDTLSTKALSSFVPNPTPRTLVSTLNGRLLDRSVQDASTAQRARSQFMALVRCSISNAPGFGAKIVDIVLKDEKLEAEWKENLKTMANRITKLDTYYKPDWDVSYTGISVKQVAAIKSKFHVYMTDEGRISMAGLNESNVKRFAEAIDWVVRNA
ncbi:PLP-dependent transferase [Rhizoclosmatium globosum]|uniref:PLP-dependent transferase n=1 Tax=Rhizoclosmatium globosum TaxID=329046 RepID=A0A1Y2D3B7_9FUNG|nr:PLP-dependent transferase [Rhizoclosmatium globosum]|eukprot:ORY53788.1 PLP-dependent transferase [Rhizoclosmatium globosum]